MYRLLLPLPLLVLPGAVGAPSVPYDSSAAVAALEDEPDTSKAVELKGWPNAQDLARLESVKGKPKSKVIEVLGHPFAVERRPNGTEVWDYPWGAACRVYIRNGVCVCTFYTGGY